MDCRNTNDAKDAAANSGATAAAPRPHWRHRDRSAPAVYVVHPTQFRTVVQQLTGAAPPATTTSSHHHHPVAASASAANAAAAAAPAMAVQHPGRGRGDQEEEMNSKSNMEQRTLAQMQQECMAWAHEY